MGVKITTHRGEGFVLLADGWITVEKSVTVELSSADDMDVQFSLEFDTELRRVVCTRVDAKRRGTGVEITATALQALSIHNVVTNTAMNVMIKVKGEHNMLTPAIEAIASFEPSKGRSRADVVVDAAKLYIIASLADWPPLKTVAERLSVSQSTATRLVAEARAQGALDSLEAYEPAPLKTREDIEWYRQHSAMRNSAEFKAALDGLAEDISG